MIKRERERERGREREGLYLCLRESDRERELTRRAGIPLDSEPDRVQPWGGHVLPQPRIDEVPCIKMLVDESDMKRESP